MKKQSERLTFYYVKKEFLELGCMQGISTQGAEVRYYDKERCICDIIRHKKEIDMQIFTQAMKVYFANKDKNLRKLLKYSEQLGIREKVKDYVEVLA